MQVKIIRKNHIEVHTKKYIYLQSYQSIVCKLEKATGVLTVNKTVRNYSRTTGKHYNLFINKYDNLITDIFVTNQSITIG